MLKYFQATLKKDLCDFHAATPSYCRTMAPASLARGHKGHFRSFSLSETTVGTKWLSVTKSPAMMLREPTLKPGVCSRSQLSRVGYVDSTTSFRDSVGCVQMYFRSSVRLIPVTKRPPRKTHKCTSDWFCTAV